MPFSGMHFSKISSLSVMKSVNDSGINTHQSHTPSPCVCLGPAPTPITEEALYLVRHCYIHHAASSTCVFVLPVWIAHPLLFQQLQNMNVSFPPPFYSFCLQESIFGYFLQFD